MSVTTAQKNVIDRAAGFQDRMDGKPRPLSNAQRQKGWDDANRLLIPSAPPGDHTHVFPTVLGGTMLQ